MTETIIIPKRRQERRNTAAALAALNEVLRDGEWCIETDTGKTKIGDGVTAYNSLRYLDTNLFAATSGTNTLTATFASKPVLYDGLMLAVRAAAANTGAATFNPNGLGALAITKLGGAALAAGDIAAAGHELLLRYRSSVPRWELLNPAAAASGGSTPTGTGFRHVAAGVEDAAAKLVDTADINNDQVTYAKMQNVSATSRVLGRKTAGAGDPEELTLSEVLDLIGSAAQGDILYRGASGWARLPAGTSGHFFKTLGAGNDPAWAAATATVGIGGSVTSGTAGSLLYVGAGPVLAQDNTNLNWNATNSTLGLGAAGGTQRLMVEQTSSANTVPVMAVRNNKTSATTTPVYVLQISRQNSATASWYFGADGNADGVIATNNAQLRIGVDVGGTFTEYAKMSAAGAFTFNSSLIAGSLTTSGSGAIVSGSTVTAATGITATTGNVVVSSGNVNVTGQVNASGNINTSAGTLSTSAGNLSITNTSAANSTPVANFRNSRTAATTTPVYSVGINRQNSGTAAWYFGADGNDDAVLATNGAQLRIGRDSGGTFTEYAKMDNAGAWTYPISVTVTGALGTTAGNLSITNTSGGDGTPVGNVRNSRTGTAISVLGINRQNSSAPALHLGADSGDNAIIAGNGGVDLRFGNFVGTTFTEYFKVGATGKITHSATNTATGTTGAQTINKPSGTVNFAAAATSLVVTNSMVTTASIVLATVRTNDGTLKSVQAVPAAGSFTLYANAAATAETSVGWMVIN